MTHLHAGFPFWDCGAGNSLAPSQLGPLTGGRFPPPYYRRNSSLQRRVVTGEAERDAAVGGAGDIGVEGEVLLHGVRVAEGARHMARLVKPVRTVEAEHH